MALIVLVGAMEGETLTLIAMPANRLMGRLHTTKVKQPTNVVTNFA
jgi:hypothetical protein